MTTEAARTFWSHGCSEYRGQRTCSLCPISPLVVIGRYARALLREASCRRVDDLTREAHDAFPSYDFVSGRR